MDKIDTLTVKFNGTNYFLWEFQFRNFVQGQELWDFVNGSSKKPSSDKLEELKNWTSKNARVISWVLHSVEPSIAINLRAYQTAADMWSHLQRIYHQEYDAQSFQLGYEIAEYNQGDKTVQEYYSGFMTLWIEYTSFMYATIPDQAIGLIQKVNESTQRHQFLMKLRHEFEPVRASLLNRSPTPSLDVCLQELLREEQRCKSQAILDLHKSDHLATPVANAYLAKDKRDMSKIQCFRC